MNHCTNCNMDFEGERCERCAPSGRGVLGASLEVLGSGLGAVAEGVGSAGLAGDVLEVVGEVGIGVAEVVGELVGDI